MSIHKSDDVFGKTSCNLSLLLVQMFIVVLEQEGEIDAMTCLALERSTPRDTFLKLQTLSGTTCTSE